MNVKDIMAEAAKIAADTAKDQIKANLERKVTEQTWIKLKANNQRLQELYKKVEAEMPTDTVNRAIQQKVLDGLKQKWATTQQGIENFEKNYELNDKGFYVAKQR
jgi:hypothetical protein